MLLEQPYIGAPALAWLSAGTQLRTETHINGFLVIPYAQRQGFVPANICLAGSVPTAADAPAIYIQLERPGRLWTNLADYSNMSFPLAAREPLLLLGRNASWQLVQRRDGQIGFVVRRQQQAEPLTGKPIGGGSLALWLGAGMVWALVNWGGLLQLLYMAPFIPYTALSVGANLLGIAVTIAMWAGPQREPERVFLMGVLVLAILLPISFLR